MSLVRWTPDAMRPLEGFLDLGGAVRVICGMVEEERFIREHGAFRRETRILRPGQTSHLPSGSFRRLLAVTRAITRHAQSQPMSTFPVDLLLLTAGPLLRSGRSAPAARPGSSS